MLTLNEAIAHAREVAETCECEASKYDMCDSYESQMAYQEGKCGKEHEQLAEWLEELKALREQTTWIPCSEKLPELRKDVLVTVRYTGFMGMYGYWTRTGHMEAKNDWWGDCAGGEVIAWMPLPQPYKVEGE